MNIYFKVKLFFYTTVCYLLARRLFVLVNNAEILNMFCFTTLRRDVFCHYHANVTEIKVGVCVCVCYTFIPRQSVMKNYVDIR